MENTNKPENPYINAMCDDNGFTQYGMTLRDYFAAKAMQSLLSTDGTTQFETRSREAYEVADEMLKQREL